MNLTQPNPETPIPNAASAAAQGRACRLHPTGKQRRARSRRPAARASHPRIARIPCRRFPQRSCGAGDRCGEKLSGGQHEVTVLKGISLDVKPGEFVSIVGPSGNGKSTLLNMITGIDRPDRGEVIVTGEKCTSMSENQLAAWRGQHVGIIFQFFQMLPALSLLQNVMLPMDFARNTRRASAKSAPCSC